MRHSGSGAIVLASLLLVPLIPGRLAAQGSEDADHYISILQREHSGLYEALLRVERAHGVLLGELSAEGQAVRSRGSNQPTAGFEADLLDRLTSLAEEDGAAEEVADEAAAGFGVLGSRAAAIIERGNSFHREVLGILADPAIVGLEARRGAVAAAVDRYSSQADLALPGEPKNMDVLYGHSQALAFRERYPDLDGFVWAGRWLELAVTEPLADLEGDERAAGLDTVETRYYSKLSFGEPPQSFPSEVPLAPAIARGLIFVSPESAMIWDNLTMLEEVLADILASPDVDDVPAAIDDALGYFSSPNHAVTGRYAWEIMALRHGIFFQGGFPLTLMTESERNAGGHMHGGNMTIVRGMGN